MQFEIFSKIHNGAGSRQFLLGDVFAARLPVIIRKDVIVL